MLEGWGKVKQGAAYAGVGDRTFGKWPKKGLRHVRLPSGTILIKYTWIDDFLESFEIVENRVDDIVREIVEKIE